MAAETAPPITADTNGCSKKLLNRDFASAFSASLAEESSIPAMIFSIPIMIWAFVSPICTFEELCTAVCLLVEANCDWRFNVPLNHVDAKGRDLARADRQLASRPHPPDEVLLGELVADPHNLTVRNLTDC